MKQKYGTFEAFKKTWAAENSTDVPEQSKPTAMPDRRILKKLRAAYAG
ncbi:MAG: hypothetical protein V8R18_03000 [Clostridium sp.]